MEKRLFDDILEWMEKYKRTTVKMATYDRLETSLNLMERYSIADIPTRDLTEDDIQDYVNTLTEDGYSFSTIRKQFHLISGFLGYTNSIGKISRVRMPAQTLVRKPKRDILVYNPIEQAALRRVLESDEMPGYFAALLMMETGMRVGECLALSWEDVDWQRRAIRVNKTFVRLGNRNRQFVQNEAKSYCSNRTIPMSHTAQTYLEKLLRRSDGSGFIFHNDTHRPLSYEALRYQITRACDKAGVPYYGQHAFRHTFATNCYNRGCDVKILSKLLGHSNVSITYNIYVHLFGDALEEMRKIVE